MASFGGLLRPFALIGAFGVVTVSAGFQLAQDGSASTHHVPGDFTTGRRFTGYDLAKLKILEPTLYHVEESYVEPGRIDWEHMYVAALEAIERKVPACKFSREGKDRLSAEIGDFRTVLEVPPVGSSRQLQLELRRVAGLLVDHLDPEKVPTSTPDADPMAEIEYALVNGILDTLDPHSILLPPPDASEMDVENQGEFGGLGITIVEREGRLVVEYPIADTPASEAGILKEDQIIRIDGESTINMSLDEAVMLLRGPVDAPVSLEIMRDSFDAPRTYELVRKLIKLNEVEGELVEGDIGLLRISSFHSNVESELHAALTKLHRESRNGLRGVVLDLRDNPGGYLNQAVAVADTFLSEGEIVSTVDGNGRKQDIEEARPTKTTEPDYPIVVLVNSNSASASEIVSGALRNNERAVIVGERTFGKGSVQNLHQFFDESKLKLTISKYLTPGDQSIQAVGIPADIELTPVRVEERGDGDKLALMYWRERVRREADLDQSLEQTSWDDEQTAYRVVYLGGEHDASPEIDVNDYQVQFAKDVILASRSSRRAEMLASAARVVDTHARRGDAEVVDAMKSLGIDWSAGSPWTGAGLPVEVVLDMGEDGGIRAGERETVGVTVTNTSSTTLFRVGVVARGNEVLEGREFLFGKLAPGESRRYEVHVNLVDGYPAEHAPVTFEVRDAGERPLGEVSSEVRVIGRALPRFSWSWSVDDRTGGDGDGVAEVGEVLDIPFEITNDGAGWSGQAFARIKNRNGRALDILDGTLEPGTLRTLDGESCAEVSRATGCQLRLAPGETWKGRFRVELKEAREEGWDLVLSLGDGEAYDHGTIVRSGFYELFTQTDHIHVDPDVAVPGTTRRHVPSIAVSRAPESVVDTETVVVSGLVEDVGGMQHVTVWGGGDKLFYEGSTGVASVPFTADVRLEPGTNIISIVAQDVDGFTSTHSLVTFLRDPEALSLTLPDKR
ncbi:MAG: PDZ domain-containing protein [Alphaproteobacteria bacterium]|nr:PDZ domain-containing protein [Alphaproteobacteria bacterium]